MADYTNTFNELVNQVNDFYRNNLKGKEHLFSDAMNVTAKAYQAHTSPSHEDWDEMCGIWNMEPHTASELYNLSAMLDEYNEMAESIYC